MTILQLLPNSKELLDLSPHFGTAGGVERGSLPVMGGLTSPVITVHCMLRLWKDRVYCFRAYTGPRGGI
jgi:hypothetical protein